MGQTTGESVARGAPPGGDENRGRVLIVEDDPGYRFFLKNLLQDEGLDVVEVEDGRKALVRVREGDIDLVLTDLVMPHMDGMQLLSSLAEECPGTRSIMLTAQGTERRVVEALKRGALDYLNKNAHPDEVVRVVHRGMETARLSLENRRLRASPPTSLIYASPQMGQLLSRLERVAAQDVGVLITGESGTGKELIAQEIYRRSRRVGRPWIHINCAAIPESLVESELFGHVRGAFSGAQSARSGLFREAHTGTLFLDEVGDLDPRIQARLLRVLQEGEIRPVGGDQPIKVDVRVIAATHHPLAEEARLGKFRPDLYYRLNNFHFHVPPLRERVEDIIPLAEHFVTRCTERFGLRERPTLSSTVLNRLREYPWQGNVRELEHTIERLVLYSPTSWIDADPFSSPGLLPVSLPSSELPLAQRVAEFEKGIIVATLEQCDHNHSEAARRLQVSRPTLIDKIKRYAIREGQG